MWKLGWAQRASVGAEAARARGVCGVGGFGSVWSGPVVREAWDGALVAGNCWGRLWAVVKLVLQPALSFSSGGQRKDKFHETRTVKRFCTSHPQRQEFYLVQTTPCSTLHTPPCAHAGLISPFSQECDCAHQLLHSPPAVNPVFTQMLL